MNGKGIPKLNDWFKDEFQRQLLLQEILRVGDNSCYRRDLVNGSWLTRRIALLSSGKVKDA